MTACDWSHPGADPLTAAPAAMVAHYTDIPGPARAALARRIERHLYSEVVPITRGRIGGGRYGELRDMHYGKGRLCAGPVDRSAWAPTHVERGLVYCEAGHCLIVPTVCRNVSRVTKANLPVVADSSPIDMSPGAGVPSVKDSLTVPGPVVLDDLPEVAALPYFDDGPRLRSGGDFAGFGLVPLPYAPYSPSAGGGVYVPPVAIPEPPAWALLAVGLVVLILRMRGKK